MNGIRIIAGAHRGRKLGVGLRPGLRPTPARVRETLFNWLQEVVVGARVLDAFAGSGALGLEALSRGAASVLFCESERQSAQNLRRCLQLWQAPNAAVHWGDALRLPAPTQAFTLIFLDPPFAASLLPQALQQFTQAEWLAPQGLLYLEYPAGAAEALPLGWRWHKQQTYASVAFGLIKRED